MMDRLAAIYLRKSLPLQVAQEQITQKVQEVLELIRPAIQADGGDVELVAVDGSIARVRFHGACIGCPSNSMTLQDSIEKNICDHVPEVDRVVAVQ